MKWTITRLFDSAKAKVTDAGKELSDMVVYLAEFCELVGRTLRNGLTFSDNFDCEVKDLVVRHDTETTIMLPDRKTASGIMVLRAIQSNSTSNLIITGFGWYVNQQGQTALKAQFSGAPTTDIKLTVVIYF